MKKIFVLILAAFLALPSFAQTKRIALLSRGGKLSSMHLKSEGNFGETPEMIAVSNKYWDSIFRADSTRMADSLARLPRKPKAGTGAKHVDPDKPQQFAPQKQHPGKAGSWLEKTCA
jgi:hypothetical protein